MMQRRSFLFGLTGAFAAPAIVRAESLMKIWVPPAPKLLTEQSLLVALEAIQDGILETYEEGTWTPVVNWNATRLDYVKFAFTPGRYVRIGKEVRLS